jgi:hypothetical protein
MNNTNYIICGNYSEEEKFEYIKNNISKNYAKLIYLCLGSDISILNKWHDNGYFQENMYVLNEDSSMQMEHFTTGSAYDGYDWVSGYNQDFDVLIIDKIKKQKSHKSLKLNSFSFWRNSGWWKVKPLYMFSNFSKNEMQEKYKNIEVIELNNS